MERIHLGSKLENCLILDQSSAMYRVLEILVSMQNNFLDETLALALESYIPALDFLRKNTKKSVIACFPCVPVADARSSDIITFEWTDNYLQFSQCNLQYGHGRDIAYDFRTIEMELANTLLLGKSYLLLKETFPLIIFNDERYKTYVHMIQELKNAIPQKKLPVGIEKELHDKKENNPKQIADLLNCLGMIMSLLRRTCGKPDMPVIEAIGDWDHFLAQSFSRKVLQSFENELCLCHIVEMNEVLEELNAGGIIEDLDDKYRVKLEENFKSIVGNFLSRSLAETVLKAEKRFVYRCLYDEEMDPTESMLAHIKDHYFWPVGALKNDSVEDGSERVLLQSLFPDEILVQHIYYYIQFLTQKIEDLKSNEQSTNGTFHQTISGKGGKELRKHQKKFAMNS